MSYHDDSAIESDYTRLLEMRADERQANEEERRRYHEEHPLWDKCRNHPDRMAKDPHCYDRQFCEECIENRQRNYADGEPHPWKNRPDYDMRYYRDEPITRDSKEKK